MGGTATFDFTGTGTGVPATFTRDTAVANPTANAPFAFTGLQLGTKDVVETPEPGSRSPTSSAPPTAPSITIGTGTGGTFAGARRRGFDPGDTTVRAVVDRPGTPRLHVSPTPRTPRSTSRSRAWAARRPSTSPAPAPASRPPSPGTPRSPTRRPTRRSRSPASSSGPRTSGNARARLHAHEHHVHRERRRDHHRHRQRRHLRPGRHGGLRSGDTTVRAVITAGDTPTCTYTNTRSHDHVRRTTVGDDRQLRLHRDRHRPARPPSPSTPRTPTPRPNTHVHLHRPDQIGTKTSPRPPARLDAHRPRLRR